MEYYQVLVIDGLGARTVPGLTEVEARTIFDGLSLAPDVRYAEYGRPADDPENRYCQGATF